MYKASKTRSEVEMRNAQLLNGTSDILEDQISRSRCNSNADAPTDEAPLWRSCRA